MKCINVKFLYLSMFVLAIFPLFSKEESQQPLRGKSCCSKLSHCSKKTQNIISNFSFDVLGDTAYTTTFEAELIQLINNTINRENVRFVVHVGDIQSSPTGLLVLPNALSTITEEGLTRARNILFSINKPLIYTPGDNDWADTVRPPINNPNPLGTLATIRRLFFTRTNVPFPFEVVAQPQEFPEFSEFVENRRWVLGNIVFVTVHTIGGDNGLASPSAEVRAESVRRIAANQAWLERAFTVAAQLQSRGIVIFTQAAIDFANPSPGFRPMINLISAKAKEIGNARQILFIYGDNHTFLVNKPLPGAPVTPPALVPIPLFKQQENFTAIQVPGFPVPGSTGATGRVRVTVNFNDPDLFNLYLSTRDQGSNGQR